MKLCLLLASLLIAASPAATTASVFRKPAAAAADAAYERTEVISQGHGDNYPYPGIDFLGVGYNVINGNPEGDPLLQVDPGFGVPIVDVKWDQNAPSRDQKNLIPAGG